MCLHEAVAEELPFVMSQRVPPPHTCLPENLAFPFVSSTDLPKLPHCIVLMGNKENIFCVLLKEYPETTTTNRGF